MMSLPQPIPSVPPARGDALRQGLTLWDWRRRVSGLYAAIRENPDPRAAHAEWRRVREALYRAHPQTPLDPGAPPPAYFDYDARLRFKVGLIPAASDRDHHLPVGRDGTVRLTPFARTDGLAARLGAELNLFWIEGYGGGAFLPFLDTTSGGGTYAGGRYLLDTIKGADLGSLPDGRLILDFNFAYNPSCVYSPRWVCPLAPSGNRLNAPVEAGERTY